MLGRNKNTNKNSGFPHKAEMTKIRSRIAVLAFLFSFFILPTILKAETVYNGGTVTAQTIADEIKTKQDKIKELTDKINAYNESIKQYKNQAVNLINQVSYLSTRISKTEAEIELTENQISENSLEIQDTENKISQNETDTKKTKQNLREFIQEIYQRDQDSGLEIILSNSSLSEYYNNLKSLNILEEKTNDALKQLKEYKTNLAILMADLENKKENLKGLKNKLEQNKNDFQEQQLAKQNILIQTKNSESKYQLLLAQAKAEQSAANADIIALEQKMRGTQSQKLQALGNANFMWPVPSRLITTYFHDPDYPFRYIYEHPAIDVGRTTQGTPVRASASGYVGQAKNAGKGYSYIMLVHADGFSTVYGHISKIYVNNDDFVSQGEIIGLSGGMPGTAGAGNLTTGPHLHFEIRKDGIPVNPLDYLP
jgi:murein DD-endopeptidase MepM/ murein hydrolase activator NlpD